ncbi:hypothetical protein [Nocardia sp. NPDC004123]
MRAVNSVDPKLVVVAGAGSGIGRATALRFARMGQQLTAQIPELAERLPFSPLSPDLVARAVVRARGGPR